MGHDSREVIQSGLLVLAAVVLMALTIPALLGYPFSGPGEVPTALNLVLAGALPAWDFVRVLAECGQPRRRPSILTSTCAGMMCVGATLMVSAVLESAVMLLSRGQLGVRFPYTTPVMSFVVVVVVVVPVGTLVGAAGWLLARAVEHQRPGGAAQHG
jgi:hypothetical protein